jgi:hypothetical protein
MEFGQSQFTGLSANPHKLKVQQDQPIFFKPALKRCAFST